MKEKTSIALSRDVIAQVDRLAGKKESRSALIERVLQEYMRQRGKITLHRRDLKRINNAADRLNREAEDVLEYQSAVDSDTRNN